MDLLRRRVAVRLRGRRHPRRWMPGRRPLRCDLSRLA